MSAPTVGHVDNSVLINADLDLVWAETNDVERWPELFTEYASAEIIHRDRDTVRFRLTMHPDENGQVWSWVSERTVDPEHKRVVARRVEPGPFEFMNIEWAYSPEREGTRMRWVQDFRMRPEAPIDTAAMTERINANTAVQMDVIRTKLERLAAERHAPNHDV
ncbi:putative polyketide cyclase [Longispora fulva]|uniref:Aromatase n=1 Tax=Longispora fulva TaxID=619741 RepID=A0A8J7GBF6_9ACTN|nr:aromatase [Longispora fulva]GIG63075.1 putative polyketide cyclase [Longispora fulva]